MPTNLYIEDSNLTVTNNLLVNDILSIKTLTPLCQPVLNYYIMSFAQSYTVLHCCRPTLTYSSPDPRVLQLFYF